MVTCVRVIIGSNYLAYLACERRITTQQVAANAAPTAYGKILYRIHRHDGEADVHSLLGPRISRRMKSIETKSSRSLFGSRLGGRMRFNEKFKTKIGHDRLLHPVVG